MLCYGKGVAVDRSSVEGNLDRLGLLLAHHGAVANTRIRQALSADGLNVRHTFVLEHLAASGSMGQQALIEALGVDPSVLVSILNDLEREGLAERRRDPADRRRHIVELSDAGAAALAKAYDSITTVERDLFGDLDADEIAQLQRLLGRIRTSTDDPACIED